MRLRYVLYMLSIAVLHAVAFSSFMAITAQFDRTWIAVPINLVFLIAVNGIGAVILFAPIQRYLKGEQDLKQALPRIHRLPVDSALWGASLVICIMSFAFFGTDAVCPGCDTLTLLPFYLSMIALFGCFVGIYLYFAIGDYATQLKEYIFERHGQIIDPVGGSLLNKFLAAFIAVGVVPISLAVLEAFVFPPARRLQGIASTDAFLFDLVIIVMMAGTSFYFIQRSLSRPIQSLTAAMHRFGQGHVDTKTPILTDDEIGVLANGFNEMVDGVRERDFLRETFGKYVPESVASAILANRGEFQPQNRLATILYADIQGFTSICEDLEPEAVVTLLNSYFSLVVPIIERHKGVVNQFQGDAMLVTFNVPIADPYHAADAIHAALEIQEALNTHHFDKGVDMITRIGINTGDVVAGSVGAGDRLSYTVHGDAVNLAARLEGLNKTYGTRILVSAFTKQLAGSDFEFETKGETPIRGRDETVEVYAVKAAK